MAKVLTQEDQPTGMTHKLEYISDGAGDIEWVHLDEGKRLLGDLCGHNGIPHTDKMLDHHTVEHVGVMAKYW